MNRRELLRLFGSAPLFHLFAGTRVLRRSYDQTAIENGRRLFFDPEDIARIRANCESQLLRNTYHEWLGENLGESREKIAKVAKTHELLTDLRNALETITRQSIIYLNTRDEERQKLIEFGLETVMALPKWDYFYEAGTEVVGLMRASLANARLLFARDVLGDKIDPELESRLLQNIADKGCAPCYLALWGMRHQDQVKGWSFDEQHGGIYDINMERWPEILNRTNLKAVPTMGLGIGALALRDHDERAEEWLEMAVYSAQSFLELFQPDGSYDEGLSYVDYALRTLLLFLEAHQRVIGNIDWFDRANFYGISEFIACTQAGWNPATKTPDIVNFSDSRKTVFPCVASWIANRGQDAMAQYISNHFSTPGYYLDFLWYRPDQTESPPPANLENKRFDLDWVVSRTGWEPEANLVAFRSGKPANHEHADRNSLIFKAYGERLLTDHFGASYDWRQPGWLLRQTEAHNAVLIDGQGHQYLDGSEGTNSSLAEASILRYVDKGETVWWCSDATQAYRLVHPAVTKVMRSVLFAKPEFLIIFDQIILDETEATIALRFHPDNRDDRATVRIRDDGGFVITRPLASLFGRALANVPLRLRSSALQLPPELGDFPYLELTARENTRVEIVTAMSAFPASRIQTLPNISITASPSVWTVGIGDHSAVIRTTREIPEITWQQVRQ